MLPWQSAGSLISTFHKGSSHWPSIESFSCVILISSSNPSVYHLTSAVAVSSCLVLQFTLLFIYPLSSSTSCIWGFMWYTELLNFCLDGWTFLYHRKITHVTVTYFIALCCCPCWLCLALLYHKTKLTLSVTVSYTIRETVVKQLQFFRHMLIWHLTSGTWVETIPHLCGFVGNLIIAAVTLSQTTALDKEKQVFRRRRHHDVKLATHLPHSLGAGASHSANFSLSPAESEDYSPSSADTVRSPISPF